MSRTVPTANIRENATFIDVGDRASTYVFNDVGANFSLALLGGGDDARKQLSEIAATGDNKWNADFENDGQSKSRLDLTDADGKITDDLIALIEAAKAGEGDLKLISADANGVVIEVEGRWSTDVIKFQGDLGIQLLKEVFETQTGSVDLGNKFGSFTVHDFDTDGTFGSIGHPNFIKPEVGSPNISANEVDEFIFAALDDFTGVEQYGPNADSIEVLAVTASAITIALDNGRGDLVGPDVMTFTGAVVEDAIADYGLFA